MLIILLIFVILGLGTIIRHLIEIRKQNDIIIEILDNIYGEVIEEVKKFKEDDP